jgi:hypothetical protein
MITATPSGPEGPRPPRWAYKLEALLVVALVVLAAVIAVTTCGCGASAIRQHASAATVLAVATQGAARIVEDAAARDVEASCPIATAEPACADAVHDAWAPADIAIGTTRTALLAYVEALSIAQHAQDGGDVISALGVALARVLVAWNELVAVLREHDVDVPALPESVLGLARLIGGP